MAKVLDPDDDVLRFVEWLRSEGYFMKKVNAYGNERWAPTDELVQKFRATAGRVRV